MKTTHVVVLPYDPKWKDDFTAIQAELEAALGDLALGIEHVGSTSVEGMSAKPCIDIDVVIPDNSVLGEVIERLAAIGYLYEGNLGIEGRHLVFREFLRQNPEAVKRYSTVKEQAARLFPEDIEGYMGYKAPCIEELYRLCGLEP